jgi:hypothetical protein
MDRIATKVVEQDWDVTRRVAELKLKREPLLEVRDVARNSSLNATPFHPANAAGTFGYQDGSWALRDRFVGDDWVLDRTGGVEAIKCEEIKVRVAFCNVDVACNTAQAPKPRSRKGAGAELASGGGLFGDDLPHYAPMPSGEWALYYLMVDEKGAAELTRPVVKGGTFVGAVERIYLSRGDDEGIKIHLDDDGVADDFDPQVARKS